MKNNRLSVNAYFNIFKQKPEYMGSVLIVVIIILNIIMQGAAFFKASSMQTLFSTAMPLVILTMAQSIVMVSGNIDISTGITMSLVNVFAVMMPTHLPWLPIWAAYVIGFSLAVLVGLINGVLVGYFRIPPMLATYGMAFVVKGFNVFISDRPQGKVARELWKSYRGDILGVPNTVFLLIFLILLWMFMRKLPRIKEMYALGGNEKSTYLTGISTAGTTLRAYLVSGAFVGLAGIMWTLMLASSNPLTGDIKTLQSVAAALIGGTLITGGWGTMTCGILGAFFMTLVNNATSYMFTKFIPSFVPGFSVSSYYQDFVGQIITMLGIIFAVVFSNKTKNKVQQIFRIDNAKEAENND